MGNKVVATVGSGRPDTGVLPPLHHLTSGIEGACGARHLGTHSQKHPGQGMREHPAGSAGRPWAPTITVGTVAGRMSAAGCARYHEREEPTVDDRAS